MANLFYTVLYSSAVIFMFGISLVPFITVDPTHSVRLWPVVNRWHSSVEGYHLVNGYGLFRRMTGVDGRPEIVIEGSNDMNSLTSWKEYHFLYKPGDITKAPKFLSKTYETNFYKILIDIRFELQFHISLDLIGRCGSRHSITIRTIPGY